MVKKVRAWIYSKYKIDISYINVLLLLILVGLLSFIVLSATFKKIKPQKKSVPVVEDVSDYGYGSDSDYEDIDDIDDF